jgi:hypothetical protein
VRNLTPEKAAEVVWACVEGIIASAAAIRMAAVVANFVSVSIREASSYRRTLHANASIDVSSFIGGAVAQLGARLDGIEEVVGSNPIGSTTTLLIGVTADFCYLLPDLNSL